MGTDAYDIIDTICEGLLNAGYKLKDLEDEDQQWDYDKILDILLYEAKVIKSDIQLKKRLMHVLCIDLENLTYTEGQSLRKILDNQTNVVYWEQDVMIYE